jgi:hypothetical protein
VSHSLSSEALLTAPGVIETSRALSLHALFPYYVPRVDAVQSHNPVSKRVGCIAVSLLFPQIL